MKTFKDYLLSEGIVTCPFSQCPYYDNKINSATDKCFLRYKPKDEDFRGEFFGGGKRPFTYYTGMGIHQHNYMVSVKECYFYKNYEKMEKIKEILK